MAPLVVALPRNRHLRRLTVAESTREQFARHQLLPAVRSNTGLLQLRVYPGEAANEAMDLVSRRPGAPPRVLW